MVHDWEQVLHVLPVDVGQDSAALELAAEAVSEVICDGREGKQLTSHMQNRIAFLLATDVMKSGNQPMSKGLSHAARHLSSAEKYLFSAPSILSAVDDQFSSR